MNETDFEVGISEANRHAVPSVVPANKVFPLDQVDSRQKALFAAIRDIWATI
jgi:hypothetical protein